MTALRRERLDRVLDRLGTHRAALVVAPAGSGKTTLLAQFAAASPAPVAWYRAEATDGTGPAVLRALERSFGLALGGFPVGASSADELVAALDGGPDDAVRLVVDDLHTLRGTPAEPVLERLVECAPARLRLVFGSRCVPGFNLSLLRVSGWLLEITADDLRFRSWEVEELFRDFYREPLPPEDLAELARRTEGWVAGLQLFHLATSGKTVAERRQMVAELGSRSRMVREYLARNVLDELPADLRRFLLETSVLGRLTGPLCDELLGASTGQETLEELERRQIFTVVVDEIGVYRYHEVLRAHLEGLLVEQVGEMEARRRYRRAGAMLEQAGAPADAFRAYCRAEDWDAVACLLGEQGRDLVNDQTGWIDTLPPGLLDQDPWVLLARARRYVALGRFDSARDAYLRAEEAFGPAAPAEICRRERRDLSLWLDTSPAVRMAWLGLLRAATQRDPGQVANQAAGLPGPNGRFTHAVATLLAGDVPEARRLLHAVTELPDLPPVLAIAARLLAAAAGFASVGPVVELKGLEDEIEALDVPWLARLWRSIVVLLATRDRPEAAPPRAAWRHDHDPWGEALISLVQAFVELQDGRPAAALFETAAQGFRALGAPVAEAWARSGLALALAAEGRADARDAAAAAIDCARFAGVDRAEDLVHLAIERLDGEQLDSEGLDTVPSRPRPGAVVVTAAPPLEIRCFGGFRLDLAGSPVDCGVLRPRPRAALRLLAMHAGRPVHREALVTALWPDVDTRTGTRNLQVALSAVRQLLEPGARRNYSLLVREGDAYRLVIPDSGVVDVRRFDAAFEEAGAAAAADEPDAAIVAFELVLATYAGELLPEDGPAEWVVRERDHYRGLAAEAAEALAELHLQRKEPRAAVTACERGLQIDRYRDALWRLLITAFTDSGDHAAAAQARRSYDTVLAELGLAPPLGVGTAAG